MRPTTLAVLGIGALALAMSCAIDAADNDDSIVTDRMLFVNVVNAVQESQMEKFREAEKSIAEITGEAADPEQLDSLKQELLNNVTAAARAEFAKAGRDWVVQTAQSNKTYTLSAGVRERAPLLLTEANAERLAAVLTDIYGGKAWTAVELPAP